ncbi:hypothetical protein ABZ916_25895 [Streptomyces sp. NPDC046853]|uniref:hypothetical protein n=1 Tax=Streptomyces sp. NPDC046853 TaxID=3154920 RepID=UPI0033FCA21B
MRLIRRALIALAVGSVALVGCASQQTPEAPLTTHVTSFNEGFADSKQDDCDQGFKPACNWLAANK